MQTIDHYNEQGNAAQLEELVKVHADLVIKIAKKIKRKLPSNIEFDDLVQSGFVGLIEASRNYRAEQGTAFETFASVRIKGSILDTLRKNSIHNRDILKQIKLMNETINQLEQHHKRPVSAAEIAEAMKMSVEEYQELCLYININHASSLDVELDQHKVAGDLTSPEENVIQDELKDRIKSMLKKLPEREQILLSLYYIEELTFKEISEVLDLTEARVCQIHAAAITKLSNKM